MERVDDARCQHTTPAAPAMPRRPAARLPAASRRAGARRACWCASIGRSTRTPSLHPLVRWQFQGGLAEDQRRAFLFTNVVGRGRPPLRHPGRGRGARGLAAHLCGRHGPAGRGDRGRLDRRRSLIRSRRSSCRRRLPAGRDHRRRSARAGQGARRAAGAGLDAGLRRRALSHGDALRHARSRHRHPEHGHLSRAAQSHRPARRAHGLAHRRRRRLSALAEAQEARHADAVRDRDRLRAGRDVHRRDEAADRSRRDGGGRRARRRADPHRQGGDRRSRWCRPTPRS